MPSNSDLKASLGAAARKAAGGITRAQAGAPPPGGPQGIFDLNGTPVTSVNTGLGLVSNTIGGVATISSENPQQDTVGAAKLTSALVWGSSLSCTPTTVGGAQPDTIFTSPTANLACTVAAGLTGPLPGQTAISITPDGTNSGHYLGVTTSGIAAGGTRSRLRFYFKATGPSAATMAPRLWLNGTAIQLWFALAPNTKAVEAGAVESFRIWKRSDGWHLVEVVFACTSGLWYIKPNSSATYTGDGSAILIAGVDYRQEYVSAVANLASGSAATVTSSSGPLLETAEVPGCGWIDGTAALAWKEIARTLSVSTIHTTLSGTDTPCAFSFLWEPYSECDAESKILELAGTTARLTISETSTSFVKLSRTNDDGTSQTVTFSRYVGLVAQALTVVVTGTRAQLYLQDRLVDDQAFQTGKACTFTSTTMGSAGLRCRFAEFAVFGAAPLAWEVIAVHQSLAAKRGWSIAPVPIWLHIGQSNCLPNGQGTDLTTFGATGDGRSLHYESDYGSDTGWGRVRLCSPRAMRMYTYSDGRSASCAAITAQGTFGSEMEFSRSLGRVATVRYAVAGTPIAQFLPGGTYNADMLAKLDLAFTSLGIPYRLEGVIVNWGESDGELLATANAFASNLESLIGTLESRYNTSNLARCMIRLHNPIVGTVVYAANVRSGQDTWAAARPTRNALVNIDDLALTTVDNIHYLSPLTQMGAGQRLATAAGLLRQTNRV